MFGDKILKAIIKWEKFDIAEKFNAIATVEQRNYIQMEVKMNELMVIFQMMGFQEIGIIYNKFIDFTNGNKTIAG